MFKEMEILHKNLQKGVDRWFEHDLQQRGRTQEEMQQMTLNSRARRFYSYRPDAAACMCCGGKPVPKDEMTVSM